MLKKIFLFTMLFTASVINAQQNAQLIRLSGNSTSTSARFLNPGEPVWYKFSINAPKRVVIYTEGEFDTYLELFNKQNVLIAENDDANGGYNAKIDTNLERGEYFIKIKEYYEKTGTFTLKIDLSDPIAEDQYEANNSRETAKIISPSNGTLRITANFHINNDVDYYKITVPSGGKMASITTESGLDTTIIIYNDKGESVVEDDDSGDELNARVNTNLVAGQYYIMVKEYNNATGDYTLLINFTEPLRGDNYEQNDIQSNAKTIEIAGNRAQITASFHTSQDVDWYRFTLNSGTRMVKIYTSGSADTIMELHGDSGLIQENDDGGEDTNSRIDTNINQGTYYLMIKEYNKATSEYTLTIEFSEPMREDNYETNNSLGEAHQLNLSGNSISLNCSFHSGTDVDWFKLTAPPDGQRVTVYTQSSIDTVIELYNKHGEKTVEDDDSGQDNNARVSTSITGGVFFIKVNPYNSEIGDYILKIEFAPPLASDRFEPNESTSSASRLNLTGSLTETNATFHIGTDIDCYRFSIDSNSQRVQIYTEGGLDTMIELYNSSLEKIDEDDDSGDDTNGMADLELTRGDYIILVKGYSETTGDYKLFIKFQAPLAQDGFEPNNNQNGARVIQLTGNTTTINATIDNKNDVDWYKITTTSGNPTYTIYTEGTLDTFIEFYDGEGNLITKDDDNGDGTNASITGTLNRGTYLIRVNEYSDGTGEYRLKINLN